MIIINNLKILLNLKTINIKTFKIQLNITIYGGYNKYISKLNIIHSGILECLKCIYSLL
ncbi:hypothetical protein BX659_11852 [Orenia metallireducens]|jgi:hypothetical protein|uniref:Uncharacterized protein n=1 Tax=Orenia metallireducens TaxID=1413210 RepID=A0A285HM52_9FIRM|nr:hypothetical protein BX659_11852 [Orenia metallireducens]SNY36767.1 hypothetical protein SAMN06265827_12137 [Orenia metallireducens]